MPAVEIRPRRATELVDASFQLLRRFYPALVTVSAIALAPTVLVRVAERRAMDPTMIRVYPGAFFFVGLVSLVCVTLADAVLTIAASEGYLTGDIDVGGAFRTGARKIVSVFLASLFRVLLLMLAAMVIAILVGIVTAIKVPVLLVAIIPVGLWAVCYVLLRTFAMIPVVVLEDTGPNVAMSRSFLLSKDSAAHIFFSLGLAVFLYFVVSGVVSALGVSLLTVTTAGILGAAVIIPIYPMLAVVSTMLYYDLRIRKEGFDLEIMSRELGGDTAPVPAA
jgi:hypothetical protein